MKIIRFSTNGHIAYGILEGDGTIRELAGSPFRSLDTSGPVKPGDVVEIEIEGIGTLQNPVVAEE